ncbi:hypothetical protein Back11_55900 [Paenibacillus baekrokdamisoli]|uniref:Uncharacterized protein n=1 Tax=Paenibacillus baekrokdamisoli TaxID=1712516 RepID=A0A3G9J7E0_9BACL|nr:discoidin domain-containing protein [Paenibacillus baekrokdamisoli]MBB3071773.1 hypothetical protein [Paenibacillus baekrokdamisoli]BBH24245.1 hypothetical protein Back11_55900 [Paenibacillus baekrokdamisoli]
MSMRKFVLSFVLCLVLFTCLFIFTASASTQASYYVDPAAGSDTNSGAIGSPFKTIEKARDTVRTINANMTGDIIVYLRGGDHVLTSALQLNQSDSGTNGNNVIYKSYPGETPVISGGQTITGWTLHDAVNNIWKADVSPSLETRQLYVNGTRAVRARTSGGLPGAIVNSTGYTTSDTNMQNWANISDVEFVYKIAWVELRVGIASISGTTITMKQPAWEMAYNIGAVTIKDNSPNPTYMENSYTFLDEQGEWYLDRTAHKIYYKPRTGENMATANVVAAKLETLVEGTGTLTNPIQHIQFEGITFAYATWLEPNGSNGFAQIQASTLSNPDYSSDVDKRVIVPTNIRFTTAKNIRLERNKFIHLGASGVGFSGGSQNNVISGNEFTDISGSGIQIGGISMNDSYPQDTRYIVKNNEIKNNYIHDVAAEYRGCVAIFVGYTEGTLISHNEISDLPYTAISLGYGWGDRDFAEKPDLILKAEDQWRAEYNVPQTSKNNVVTYNHIYNIMTYLRDGGGIYNLGAQPGGVIEGNYIHDVHDEFGAIYLDSGSRYLTVANNILHSYVTNVIDTSNDSDIEFNYWTINNGYWWARSGLVANNYTIGNGNVPSSILDNVGLEAAYADLLPRTNVNFALGKTASAYYNNGSAATMHAGSEAYRAVDGNPATYALATNQFAWTQEVDLGNSYTIDRVVTIFAANPPTTANLWATDYEIQVSTIGGNGNFTTVKTVTGSTGGVSEQTFTPVNARYVRIKAIKPDAGGQTGTQMAIAELQVYGKVAFTPSSLPVRAPAITPIYNRAFAQKATGYYNDGSPAFMQTLSEAYNAVDGNPNTSAIAANQYPWTLEVDLGDLYNINRVRTLFLPNNYATNYEIQVSATGGSGSFTTVKTVTGGTGGLNEQTFTPVVARFVRIKAIKPDGAGQTGAQMAIAELEVYEYFNYAYKKSTTTYYSDGSPATMQVGAEAANALDANATTLAMASNQYAWSQVVDLGQVVDIDKIEVVFGPNNWATSFEIAVSDTSPTSGYGLLTGVTEYGVADGRRSITRFITTPPTYMEPAHVSARYVRIKGTKPDGPGQAGNQMAISELLVYASNRALKLSQKTDGAAADKYYYRTISNQSFTFQAGDVISYDVKLSTNSSEIGGIDIKNTDNSVFRDQVWQDQNGITGKPTGDLRSKAFGKWYHRELTVPSTMAGKTSASWMLAFENDSVSEVLQASYDNIRVTRAGVTVMTLYRSGNPSVNVLDRSSHYSTDAPASMVNRN